MCYEKVWVVLLTGRPQLVKLQLKNSSFPCFPFLARLTLTLVFAFGDLLQLRLWAQQVHSVRELQLIFIYFELTKCTLLVAALHLLSDKGSLCVFSIYFSLCNWDWSKFCASPPHSILNNKRFFFFNTFQFLKQVCDTLEPFLNVFYDWFFYFMIILSFSRDRPGWKPLQPLSMFFIFFYFYSTFGSSFYSLSEQLEYKSNKCIWVCPASCTWWL